jgi:hypothetical protein
VSISEYKLPSGFLGGRRAATRFFRLKKPKYDNPLTLFAV